MPQFDTFSFLSQLFWLFSSFLVLLFFFNYYLLPVISTVLKVRDTVLSFNFSLPWKILYTFSFLQDFLKVSLTGFLELFAAEKNTKSFIAFLGNFTVDNTFGNTFLKDLFQKLLNIILISK